MVQVIQEPGKFENFADFGTILGDVLGKRNEQKKEEGYKSALADVMASSTNEEGILDYDRFAQGILERQIPTSIVKQYAGMPDFQKARMTAKGKVAQTPFEKKREEQGANQVAAIEQRLAGYQKDKQTISDLRNLSDETSGIIGTAKSMYGMGDAAEFDAKAIDLLKGKLETFNPRGAIPTRKLELLKEMTVPKATELQITQLAKIKAAEDTLNMAEAIDRASMQLYEQYNGKVPAEAWAALDADINDMVDAITKQAYKDTGEYNPQKSLPPAGTAIGEIQVEVDENDKPTGKRFKWTGETWIEV